MAVRVGLASFATRPLPRLWLERHTAAPLFRARRRHPRLEPEDEDWQDAAEIAGHSAGGHHVVRTPHDRKSGEVDYDSVAEGAAIWVSSKKHGRPILLERQGGKWRLVAIGHRKGSPGADEEEPSPAPGGKLGKSWLLLEKASAIRTPLTPEGKVDYDSVPNGASIWVTVTDESSPMHGRPILISKRPDGQFALRGGSGYQHWGHGAEGMAPPSEPRAVAARRHLVLPMGGQRPERKAYIEAGKQRIKARSELLETRRALNTHLREAADSMRESLAIPKSLHQEAVSRIQNGAYEMARSQGISHEGAQYMAELMGKAYSKHLKQLGNLQAARRGQRLLANQDTIRSLQAQAAAGDQKAAAKLKALLVRKVIRNTARGGDPNDPASQLGITTPEEGQDLLSSWLQGAGGKQGRAEKMAEGQKRRRVSEARVQRKPAGTTAGGDEDAGDETEAPPDLQKAMDAMLAWEKGQAAAKEAKRQARADARKAKQGGVPGTAQEPLPEPEKEAKARPDNKTRAKVEQALNRVVDDHSQAVTQGVNEGEADADTAQAPDFAPPGAAPPSGTVPPLVDEDASQTPGAEAAADVADAPSEHRDPSEQTGAAAQGAEESEAGDPALGQAVDAAGADNAALPSGDPPPDEALTPEEEAAGDRILRELNGLDPEKMTPTLRSFQAAMAKKAELDAMIKPRTPGLQVAAQSSLEQLRVEAKDAGLDGEAFNHWLDYHGRTDEYNADGDLYEALSRHWGEHDSLDSREVPHVVMDAAEKWLKRVGGRDALGAQTGFSWGSDAEALRDVLNSEGKREALRALGNVNADQARDLERLANRVSRRPKIGMGPHIRDGAATALAALAAKHLDVAPILDEHGNELGSAALNVELGRLVSRSSPEVAAHVLALHAKALAPDRLRELSQRVSDYNVTNQAKGEAAVMARHSVLTKQLAEIERQEQAGELRHKATLMTLKQKQQALIRENLGVGLGSLQASAALAHALDYYQHHDDAPLALNFGDNHAGAVKALEDLRLGEHAHLSYDQERGWVALVRSRDLAKHFASGAKDRARHEVYDRIKMNDRHTETDAEGRVFATNFRPFGFREELPGGAPNRPFVEQRNDIQWLGRSMDDAAAGREAGEHSHAGGGVVTRDTGAGKTNTAFGTWGERALKAFQQGHQSSAIFVVPNQGRVAQWASEAGKFTHFVDQGKVLALDDDQPEWKSRSRGWQQRTRDHIQAHWKPGMALILSHDHALAAADVLHAKFGARGGHDAEHSLISVDEPQMLKGQGQSPGAKSTVRRLFGLPIQNRMALTATLARDHPLEAYDWVNWTNPGALGGRARFGRVYSGFGAGANALDEAVQSELSSDLNPYISSGMLQAPHYTTRFHGLDEGEALRRTDQQVDRQKLLEEGADRILGQRFAYHLNKAPAAERETRQGRAKARAKAQADLYAMHWDNLHGLGTLGNAELDRQEPGRWEHNAKLREFVKRVGTPDSNGTRKHVIFVDSAGQREGVMQALAAQGWGKEAVRDITSIPRDPYAAAGRTEDPTKRGLPSIDQAKREWNGDDKVPFMLIDKKAAEGHNLQAADVEHVLGAPEDWANYRQAVGRILRMSRHGDARVEVYRHHDSPFEFKRWNGLMQEAKLMRAVAPSMAEGARSGVIPAGPKAEAPEAEPALARGGLGALGGALLVRQPAPLLFRAGLLGKIGGAARSLLGGRPRGAPAAPAPHPIDQYLHGRTPEDAGRWLQDVRVSHEHALRQKDPAIKQAAVQNLHAVLSHVAQREPSWGYAGNKGWDRALQQAHHTLLRNGGPAVPFAPRPAPPPKLASSPGRATSGKARGTGRGTAVGTKAAPPAAPKYSAKLGQAALSGLNRPGLPSNAAWRAQQGPRRIMQGGLVQAETERAQRLGIDPTKVGPSELHARGFAHAQHVHAALVKLHGAANAPTRPAAAPAPAAPAAAPAAAAAAPAQPARAPRAAAPKPAPTPPPVQLGATPLPKAPTPAAARNPAAPVAPAAGAKRTRLPAAAPKPAPTPPPVQLGATPLPRAPTPRPAKPAAAAQPAAAAARPALRVVSRGTPPTATQKRTARASSTLQQYTQQQTAPATPSRRFPGAPTGRNPMGISDAQMKQLTPEEHGRLRIAEARSDFAAGRKVLDDAQRRRRDARFEKKFSKRPPAQQPTVALAKSVRLGLDHRTLAVPAGVPLDDAHLEQLFLQHAPDPAAMAHLRTLDTLGHTAIVQDIARGKAPNAAERVGALRAARLLDGLTQQHAARLKGIPPGSPERRPALRQVGNLLIGLARAHQQHGLHRHPEFIRAYGKLVQLYRKERGHGLFATPSWKYEQPGARR